MTPPSSDIGRDLGAAIAKSAPPLTVWALTLNEWLAVASIVYILLQGAYLVWKWTREAQRRASHDT